MIRQPFSLFSPFSNRVEIRFFTTADGIASDEDLMKVMNGIDLASVQQVHGNKTIMVRAPVMRASGADGLLTDTKNLTLSIRVADCQSFVVYEPKSNVVGVLHAGWKGLINRAIPEFFKALHDEWNIDAGDTFVGAGPSLCQTCAEFTDPVLELPGINPQFINGRCVDLRAYADRQLMDAGVRHGRIERMQDCTKCKSNIYHSYRGGDRGAVKEGYENVLTCILK